MYVVEKSEKDLFQNLITAFFSEVPSAWSHEWMSNASWIKHVGACALTLCPQVYRYLRMYNIWYDHSKLVEFRTKEKRIAIEIGGYFITSSSFFVFADGITSIVDYFFIITYNAYKSYFKIIKEEINLKLWNIIKKREYIISNFLCFHWIIFIILSHYFSIMIHNA